MDKKYITKFVAYLLFLIVPAIGYAGDIEFSLPDSLQPLDFWDGGGGFIGKAAATLCPPLPALIAIPQMGLVDTLDVYQIKLTLPKGGIPFLGGVSFSFPATFDLSQISEIEYSDDYSGDDLKIRRIYIHNGIITLFFKWGKSPPAGTVITFTVHSIKNPTVAGEYQIAGLIFNKWFRVEAGPTLSDRFTIYPDKPVSIIISPSDHLALRAEETQVFTAEVHDKFGNIIEGLNINWALSADFDKIGIISDGYLFATTVGHGKVVASFENLSAMSGLITVLPGAVDHFVVSGVPQEVEAGVPFLSAVTVTAFDKFGNLKSDYIGSIYFTSTDARAVLIYNESNQYAFASSDSGRHAFDGADFTLVTAGQQTITVTDGVHSGVSAPIIISSGKIVAFNIVVINGHPLRAGDPIYLEAAGAVDRFGNPAGGKIEVRQVVGGPSPGGFQSVLNDIIVVNGKGSANQYIYAAGEAVLRASIDTVFREAELIVLPAALGTLKLDIQPTQFVGHPLFGPATLTCSDKFGNLKTDFNTLDNPIDLSVDKGELSRTRLDSADDFVNGVADLTTKNIIYSGEAGTIRLTASASPGITVSADLSYNGVSFDLVGPLPDSIYAGQTIRVDARLQNKGDLPTLPAVLFSAHLGSCPNQCAVEREISSIPPNGVFRVSAAVPSDSAQPNIDDTLSIEVTSKYYYGNDTIVITRSRSYSVHIIDRLSFSYVDGSLTVDTVLSPSILPSLSFRIQSNRKIDVEQLRASVSLSMKLDDTTWIQFGWPRLDTSIDDQVFTFEQSGVQIPELIEKYHTEGYKSLKAAIVFYGGTDKLFRFEDSIVGFDSLYVVFASKLTYVTSSLSPRTVSGGMNHAFEFDLNLTGSTTISIDDLNSVMTFVHDDGVIYASLAEFPRPLRAGANHFVTDEINIPINLVGKQLRPSLTIVGKELYSFRTDLMNFGSDVITVTSLPQMKIVSTELVTVNPPFVNYGQQFSIKVGLQNLSADTIHDVSVFVTSENGKDTLSVQSGQVIPPLTGIDVMLPMTAKNVSIPIKIFKAFISSPEALVLPAEDNTAAVTVQSPAVIKLVAFPEGLGSYPYVDYGETFSIAAKLENEGEAGISSGEVSLSTGGYDFGVPDPSPLTIDADSTAYWNLIAPSVTASVRLKINLTQVPLDKNTGLPAGVAVDSVEIPLDVEPAQAELLVNGVVSQAPLVIEGASRELFSLELKNNTENPINIIGLKSIDIHISDRADRVILPDAIIIMEESGFYSGRAKITSAQVVDNLLRLTFADFRLGAKDEVTLAFIAGFKDKISVSGFKVTIENRDIRAIFVSGPRLNQPVPVRGKYESNFRIGGSFVITAHSLERSLIVRNNPFNPDLQMAEVAYNLEADAPITMKVYTLTGEEVFEKTFPAGSEGGREGSNYISWDGRNDEGKVVLNGAYVMIVRDERSGQSYKLKLAVMK